MQALLVVAYTLLFIRVISRRPFFQIQGVNRIYVYSFFLLKVFAGCALGWIYTYYYTDQTTADTFKFFDDSRIMYRVLFNNPLHFLEMFTGVNGHAEHLNQYYSQMNAWNNQDVLFNDNKTLVRLNVLFNFFSLGYYYVHVLFLNVLSFTGLIALFRLFQNHHRSNSQLMFFATMFLPSLLFWGSGLLKDGLLLFAFGFLLYSFHKMNRSIHSTKDIVMFCLSMLLLLFTKLYVLIITLPGLVAWYWSRKDTSAVKIILKFMVGYFIFFIIAFNIWRVNEKYDVADILYYKQRNFYVLANNTKAQSLIQIPPLDATAASLIKHAPAAIARVFVRPSPFDAHSLLIGMAALENILIILVAVFCVFKMKRNSNVNNAFFWFSIFFVTCIFALIGLITPILGAMVRYKVVALPFLMFVLVSLLPNFTRTTK